MSINGQRTRSGFVRRSLADYAKRKWSKRSGLTPDAALVIALVFFSIVPYASASIWWEAVFAAAILAFSAHRLLRRGESQAAEGRSLLMPLYALSIYSLAQGVLTIFVQGEISSAFPLIPESFDPAASLWCALKIFAIAVFVRFALGVFRRNIELLIWGLIATGGVFAAFGILRFWVQNSLPGAFESFGLLPLEANVGFGTHLNQNHFAFLMLLDFGLCSALCVYGGLEKTRRLLLFIVCLATWTAIVLTASRGGIISSFAAVFVLILAPPAAGFFKWKSGFSAGRLLSRLNALGKRLTIAAALAALLVFGVSLIGSARVAHRFETLPQQFQASGSREAYRRIDVWRAALSMIGERPLYGVGFGGFQYAVSQYINISGESVPQQAHNDYLELAASGGIVGAAIAVWFLCELFKMSAEGFFASAVSGSFEHAARLGAITAFAAVAVHSFFDFGLQLFGNQLYLAGLLAIAVYKTDENKNRAGGLPATPTEMPPDASGRRKNLCLAAFLLCLAAIGLTYGFSRLENARAERGLPPLFDRTDIPVFPFDADYYAARAKVAEGSGDYSLAAENLHRAIANRPNDYALWLELGNIRRRQNLPAETENAFRQAIRLAPHYSEPRFSFGEFLVAENRKAEGFAELSNAFRRSPRRFEPVMNIFWRETEGSAERSIELAAPQNAVEKERLAAFLFERESFAAIAGLVCREADLPIEHRAALITKLLEKRQFFIARRIYERECDETKSLESRFDDGDFESGELRERLGFGWRAGDLPASAVRIGFDNLNAASGAESLAILFGGDFDPATALVSQTIVVEKNRRYRLSFAFASEEIVTGGVPVLQIVFKQPEADQISREIPLTPVNRGWNEISTRFDTGSRTEAVEIRVARQSCRDFAPGNRCPIFGRLWMDNFILR